MRKNPKAQKFWDTLMRYSERKDKKCIDEWKFKGYGGFTDSKCICGTRIYKSFEMENDGHRLVIGSCCAKRFGINLNFKGKSAFLRSCMKLAKDDWEMQFVCSLMDRQVRWGSKLIISEKEKAILGRIAGRPWRWQTWDRWKDTHQYL